ncbi:hypothetical protein ANCDUO_24388 [Ancylostoma duodenale]|uniref:Uncharacterized protein n=1 Tax=Ancylostoma duodenale TaxID=51022 RepID=A0A0C2FL32_9BILA|nr:hypothetical protein ANCDUO_24388 [Ancylostoma duodenale]
MSHRLSEQRFQSFEDVVKWVKEWIKSNDKASHSCCIRLFPEKWEKQKRSTYTDYEILESGRTPTHHFATGRVIPKASKALLECHFVDK